MIKIKSEVLTILNKWFDEYFNLYYPLAKETLMFNILKNYEFKVYQTYLSDLDKVKDLLLITQKTLITLGVKCLDDNQTSKRKIILKGFSTLNQCYHIIKNNLIN